MHLGADEPVAPAHLLPVRMLNEFTYCPRLFYLEFVQNEFADNEHTLDGQFAHRRVNAGGGGPLPAPDAERPFEVRSVALSSASLGLSAKIDLVEGEGGSVVPVDYKRGSPPENEERSYEPERVQLCAYGLLLREHGYRSESGVLYFAESKTRVEIPFSDGLVERTRTLLKQAGEAAHAGQIPPPLVASPKCNGCSLHSICLPDEVNHLNARTEDAAAMRNLVPARDDAKPLYIQEQGARIGIDGEVLCVKDREHKTLAEVKLLDVSHVALVGNVQISSQAARELFGLGIPICWMTFGGWLAGLSDGLGHGNIELRRAQFRKADDPAVCLDVARRIVRNKIANCRTLMRRNHANPSEQALRDLAILVRSVDEASDLQQLLGIEGNGARIYFGAFSGMLRPAAGEEMDFDFTTRTRRPPKDPVNALLSLSYSLLAKDLAIRVRLVGLDPFLGYYHQPRFGRPALALDLMEEFRPLLADSAVITAINTHVVGGDDFVRGPLGVALKTEGRRRFLRAYERRMQEEVTHPVFGYQVSYRRVLEVQVRLFARYLMGELREYPEFRTR